MKEKERTKKDRAKDSPENTNSAKKKEMRKKIFKRELELKI
jgi:hypothetical protein